jgi:hypothetical protein
LVVCGDQPVTQPITKTLAASRRLQVALRQPDRAPIINRAFDLGAVNSTATSFVQQTNKALTEHDDAV